MRGIVCEASFWDSIKHNTAGQDFNYVAGDYVLSIERAGGIPLLIPQTCDFENLKPLLDLCDGTQNNKDGE